MTKVLGPLNYEVAVDGHSCQAHVANLLPGVSNWDIQSPTPDKSRVAQGSDDTTNETIVPLVPLKAEDSSMNDSEGQELGILRPHGNRHPPMRLIEEMN